MKKPSARKVNIMHKRLLSKPIVKLMEGNLYYAGVVAGIYFGYPDCCITDFAERLDKGRPQETEAQQKTHNFVGFIPCPTCAENILARKITQASLIKNRLCDFEFPNDGNGYYAIKEMTIIEAGVIRKIKTQKKTKKRKK